MRSRTAPRESESIKVEFCFVLGRAPAVTFAGPGEHCHRLKSLWMFALSFFLHGLDKLPRLGILQHPVNDLVVGDPLLTLPKRLLDDPGDDGEGILILPKPYFSYVVHSSNLVAGDTVSSAAPETNDCTLAKDMIAQALHERRYLLVFAAVKRHLWVTVTPSFFDQRFEPSYF
jgi:hypothetical protein